MSKQLREGKVEAERVKGRAIRLLSNDAPPIRTATDIVRKHEQIQDALDRGAISPKVAEQMGQTLKGITKIASLEIQLWNVLAKLGRRAPVPKNPILRGMLGLGDKVAPEDGEQVRQLLGGAAQA